MPPEENTIIINNYAGGPPDYPLEEIPVGVEVSRYHHPSHSTDYPGWSWTPGVDEMPVIEFRPGKVYIVYEQDAES